MSMTRQNGRSGFLASVGSALRLWPLQVLLLLCACLLFAAPAQNLIRFAQAGPVAGGIQIDTSGAKGHGDALRYTLDLPVQIVNGDSNVILGVSLWVESLACPSAQSPTSACRRLTAFEQHVPMQVRPGYATKVSQSYASPAPHSDEVIRIRRKLMSVDDENSLRDAEH